MSVQWDQDAINAAVANAERQVRAQMRPVLETKIAGAFPLNDEANGFSVGPAGIAAEYAGQSWAVSAMAGREYGGQ